MPEKFAGFLSAEEGGVFLDCNILEAGILGFRECGEVFVEFGKGIVSLAIGFWELDLGARDQGGKDGGGKEGDGVFGVCAMAEEGKEGLVGIWMFKKDGGEGGNICVCVSCGASNRAAVHLAAVPLIKSPVKTSMYCMTSALFAADSSTLLPWLPPISSDL